MGDNIREIVWKVLDTDISLKKDLGRGVLNIRSLAKYILKTQKLDASLDAVISAIRRYDTSSKKEEDKSAYNMLKNARINTKTKMASLLLKRADEIKTILGRPDKVVDYKAHEVVRVFEGSQAMTLVFDRKNYEKVYNMFPKKTILRTHKKIGIIEIAYPLELEKTPGVFNILASELAENNISIIDAVISSNEHIIVVEESQLLRAFELIYTLCS